MRTTRGQQSSHVRRDQQGSQVRSRPWRAVPASLALGFCVASVTTGCQLFGQDPAKCDQSVSTVRESIRLEDFQAARAWRDYTWKVCDERAVIATLDKEITDAEAALARAALEKAQKQAQGSINRAQSLWRKFDAAEPTLRNREALDATRKSAKRLEKGLSTEYSSKLRAYNESEYQKRLAALGR